MFSNTKGAVDFVECEVDLYGVWSMNFQDLGLSHLYTILFQSAYLKFYLPVQNSLRKIVLLTFLSILGTDLSY